MAEKSNIKLKRITFDKSSLTARAYDTLKKAIITGDLPSGYWLRQEELTKTLGVSFTPLREAFNRLKSDGLVEVLPQKGVYVIQFSDGELDDLFESRDAIETAFFIRSAQKISLEELERIRQSFRVFEEAMAKTEGDPELWNKERKCYLEGDRSFHDKLISSCGNKQWIQLYYCIRDRIDIYGHQLSFYPNYFRVSIEDHHAILDALMEKRFEEGKELMSEHIEKVRLGIHAIRRQQPK